MSFLKEYIVTLVIFLLIDAVWLLLIAKDFYSKEIGHLMSSSPNLIPALIFYALFAVGIVFFVVDPALEKESLKYAIIAGILFGVVAYSTYDLTNFATMKDWPLKVVLIDIVWGGFLTGSVSVLSFLILK